MQIYTNCESCNFFDGDQERCSEGLWEREGFQGLIKYDAEAGGHIIQGKVCGMHRAGGNTTFDQATNEAYLSYGLIISVKDGKSEEFLGVLRDFSNLEARLMPDNIYVIDNRDDKSDQEHLREKIALILAPTAIPFRYKNTLTQDWVDEKYIDEYAANGVVKNPFYVYFNLEKLDPNFLKGLWHKIYYDMMDVMYGGKDDCYFAPTALHKICRSGLDKFLRKEKLEHTIFSYEELCKTI